MKFKPVNLKGKPTLKVGRTDAEAEAPVFWSSDTNSADSLEKSLMLGKIEGRRRGHQRMRWLDGITDAMDMNGLGQNLGDGEGQGGLECYNSWGHKELDTT